MTDFTAKEIAETIRKMSASEREDLTIGTLIQIASELKRIADMLEANQKGEANFNVETGLEKINYDRLRNAIHYRDSRP